MLWKKDELNDLPEFLSLDKFREFCHISKLTARYFLKSGLLKNTNTGKQTRCYRIAKTDLIEFLEAYEKNPKKFRIKDNWYSTTGHIYTDAKSLSKKQKAKIDAVYEYSMNEYYEKYLKTKPEVLTIEDIEEITGYSRSTVKTWYGKGKMRCLTTKPRLMVPRNFLLEFLISDFFNSIVRKTDTHIQHLKNIDKLTDNNMVKRRLR